MDTFDILLNGLKEIPGLDDGKYRLLYPFKGSIENKQRYYWGIPNDERVVYIFNQLVITDRAIYSRFISEDNQTQIPFRFVTKVMFDEDTGSYIFLDDGDNALTIGRLYLTRILECEKCYSFAKVLDEAVKSVFSWHDYLK